MKNIVINIQNNLLAEAITVMLSASGEFFPLRVPVGDKKNNVVDNCKMISADIVLMEVSHANNTTVEVRLGAVKELRKEIPHCKIVLLCDENSTPDIADKVILAKKNNLIDNFFYSSVTAKYLLAALTSM